ncbi:unnamed protein product, partial [Phaeothamnion confervicola]
RARNVVDVNGRPFLKMGCIGRGGSSKVFRVLSPDGEVLALKRVRQEPAAGDKNRGDNGNGRGGGGGGGGSSAALAGYTNEIALLRRLAGNPAIIQLVDAEMNKRRGQVLMVMELGEIDLHQLLNAHKAAVGYGGCVHGYGYHGGGGHHGGHCGGGLSPNLVRLTWQQMLEAVRALHEQRIVHGDLKPANFVFVRGRLKLIDFGIAKAISNDTTNISRESQVGTLNYMCPEAILDTGKGAVDPATGRRGPLMKLGRAGDVWSLGCILFQMAHGSPPFAHLRFVQKLQAIVDKNHPIPYGRVADPALLNSMRRCLQRDPAARAPIDGDGGLLSHPYLNPT